jgi:dTDP-4-amino-4,6-dideoxygalactose transaminase
MQDNASNQIPVPLLDVSRGNQQIRDEVLSALAEVYDSGKFLHGPQVTELEERVAAICNTKHAIGCASGSDALLLALMALDIQPGDEVILPSFTFFATASCVDRLGAKIVFADIDPRTFNIAAAEIESKITSRTRAIIPVHLFGQAAEMDAICKIAMAHDIPVIEDAAQAIGAAYHGRPVCSWGQIGCLSFYPTKNLGGFGDGGMVALDSDTIADRLRLLAGHGMRPRYHHSAVGINSRLDTLQAAALLVKTKRLADYNAARQAHAKRYIELFEQAGIVAGSDAPGVVMPYRATAAHHVWNQFSIRVPEEKANNGGVINRRDALRSYLQERNIGSEIYYPIPLHQQVCFRHVRVEPGSLPETERATREILNLPIYPEFTAREQEQVVATIGNFLKSSRQRAVA